MLLFKYIKVSFTAKVQVQSKSELRGGSSAQDI